MDAHLDPATSVGAIERIAEQLGVHQALRTWVPQAEIDGGQRPSDGIGCFRGSGARPQTEVIVAHIDEHRERVVESRRLGAEPICEVLADAEVQIAPSTYYAAKTRAPRARAVRDPETG